MSSLPPAAPPLAVPLPVRPGCSVGFMAARAHTRPLNCRVAAPRRCTASLHRGSRALRSPLPLSQVMTEQEGKQSSHLPAAKYFCAQPRSTAAGTTAVTAVDRGRDDGRESRPSPAPEHPSSYPSSKGLWRGVGEPLFSPCQKGINEFVSGSHVAELIQHQKVIDYTATIQWLPHSISTFFGLLRAFHAATLHHTAKRRLDHIQQPTVRL